MGSCCGLIITIFISIVGLQNVDKLYEVSDPAFTSVGALSFQTGWYDYGGEWMFDDTLGLSALL